MTSLTTEDNNFYYFIWTIVIKDGKENKKYFLLQKYMFFSKKIGEENSYRLIDETEEKITSGKIVNLFVIDNLNIICFYLGANSLFIVNGYEQNLLNFLSAEIGSGAEKENFAEKLFT